jgi:hypothetical protein
MDLQCDMVARIHFEMTMCAICVDYAAKQFATIALCLRHDMPDA